MNDRINIFGNQKLKLSLDKPTGKAVMWHLTSRCNQQCKYCYGSFDGSSYYNNLNSNIDVPLDSILKSIAELSANQFNRIHFCGGEVFLRHDLEEILKESKKQNIESYVLSNFLKLPHNIEDMLKDGLFSGLAFSIDSLDEEYNKYIRGHHQVVFDNLNKVLSIKKKYSLDVEIGLYMVLTKKNQEMIIPLLDWAEEIGIDYVSIQIVYLPQNHPYYHELTVDDSRWIAMIYHQMEERSFARVSNIVLSSLTDILLENSEVYVDSCFACKDKSFLFIDGEGNVSPCVTDRIPLGNITTSSINNCLNNINLEDNHICKNISANCLGVWEMLYPEHK